VPNETLDALARVNLNGREFQMVILLIRQTYGYWREEDHLGPNFMEQKTYIDRDNCYHVLARLKSLGIVSSPQPGTYRLNPPSQWLPAAFRSPPIRAHARGRSPLPSAAVDAVRGSTLLSSATVADVTGDSTLLSSATVADVTGDSTLLSSATVADVTGDSTLLSSATVADVTGDSTLLSSATVADVTGDSKSDSSKSNLLNQTLNPTKIPDGPSAVGGGVVQAPHRKKAQGSPDPRVTEVLQAVERRLGYPIAHWAKEAAAVKRGLRMGYTPEEILGCWETMRGFAFWRGRWLPMATVVDNLGAYREGVLMEWRPPGRATRTETYRV
jgi:phage replication O-like protein O